jgi:hypothetical protein
MWHVEGVTSTSDRWYDLHYEVEALKREADENSFRRGEVERDLGLRRVRFLTTFIRDA